MREIGVLQFAIVIVILVLCVVIVTKKDEEAFSNIRHVTFHYANWCPHCRDMKPVWEAVKQSAGSDFMFHEVDEERTPTPGINSYPTIIMTDGSMRRTYQEGPSVARLSAWLRMP